jgi:hypothetical protein
MADPHPKADVTVALNEYVNEYIRYADTKSAFAITIVAALVAAVFQKEIEWYTYLSSVISPCGLKVSSLLAWLFLLSCGSTIAIGIWAVYPRTSKKPPKGLIFWENVAAFDSPEQFRKAFMSTADDDMVERLVEQNYYLSVTACKKYTALRILLIATGLSVVCGLLVLIFL